MSGQQLYAVQVTRLFVVALVFFPLTTVHVAPPPPAHDANEYAANQGTILQTSALVLVSHVREVLISPLEPI